MEVVIRWEKGLWLIQAVPYGYRLFLLKNWSSVIHKVDVCGFRVLGVERRG
jgi:hypothetical protein